MPEICMKFKAKRGRPRKFSPEELLRAFEKYVNEMTAHPIELIETEEGFIGRSRIDKTKTKTMPQLLTIQDFCVYLGTSRNWWKELPDEDYLAVKTRIKDFLEAYQLKGAASGAFKDNIVARLLGLTDKKDITSGGEKLDRIIVENNEQKERIAGMKDLEV